MGAPPIHKPLRPALVSCPRSSLPLAPDAEDQQATETKETLAWDVFGLIADQRRPN